jgi:hypothetical protein
MLSTITFSFLTGVVHIVVDVILLSITVSGLTEEWFILLYLVILFDHYCFMFDRGVVHIIVADYNVDHYRFMFDRGVVHIIVADYNVDHYRFMFDRGVVHIIVT